EGQCFRRLRRKVSKVAGFHLHTIGQLEALDACQQVRFAVMLFQMIRIDALEEIKLCTLVFARDVFRSSKIQYGGTRRTEERALIAGWEKAGAPAQRSPFDALVIAEHYISREILAFAPEAVGDPGARARKTRPANAGIDLVEGGHVIIRLRVKRFDERKI